MSPALFRREEGRGRGNKFKDDMVSNDRVLCMFIGIVHGDIAAVLIIVMGISVFLHILFLFIIVNLL